MKKTAIILTALFVLFFSGCDTGMTGTTEDTTQWQQLTGSAGIGFWAYGNDPDNPDALLVFMKTSTEARIEYWEGREKIRGADWLDCTAGAITYRAPNREIFTQTYIISSYGLWIDESPGIIWGGIFWRRETPSWWSENFSFSAPHLTGSKGIGFWGAGDDPDDPEYVWVFINTGALARIEFWINRRLSDWGYWIDATDDTILYRRREYINPAAQTYRVENNNKLWLDEHSSGIAWGGPWWRFDGPEWWTLEQLEEVEKNDKNDGI